MKRGHVCCALIYNKDEKMVTQKRRHSCNLDIGQLCIFFPFYFTSFSGQRPAQRECARTELRSHARCHPYPIPQPVKFTTPTLFE